MTIGEFMVMNLHPCIGFETCSAINLNSPHTQYGLTDDTPKEVYDTKIKNFSFRNVAHDNIVYVFYI